MSSMHITAELEGEPTPSRLKELAPILGRGAMGIRRDWTEGRPVLEVRMFETERFDVSVRRMQDLTRWTEANGVGIRFVETDPEVDPSHRRVLPKEEALGRMEAAWDEMSAEGVFDVEPRPGA